MPSSRHKSDDKHALKLEFWEPGDFSIDVLHPQSCSVWFGCELREKDGVQRLGGCPNYHHAHHTYDCPIGYLIENYGLGDALFMGDHEFMDKQLETLKRYFDEAVPIHYDFSWGMSGYYEPEYEEELIWDFQPYYTHTWSRQAAICTVCHATSHYVYENNYRCEVPDGKPE